MKVSISLDFDQLKDDICDQYANRLDDLGYDNKTIERLVKSFHENIDGGYIDATFEVEMNRDETEVTACTLIGG